MTIEWFDLVMVSCLGYFLAIRTRKMEINANDIVLLAASTSLGFYSLRDFIADSTTVYIGFAATIFLACAVYLGVSLIRNRGSLHLHFRDSLICTFLLRAIGVGEQYILTALLVFWIILIAVAIKHSRVKGESAGA